MAVKLIRGAGDPGDRAVSFGASWTKRPGWRHVICLEFWRRQWCIEFGRGDGYDW